MITCKFCENEIGSKIYVLKIPSFYRNACKFEHMFCSNTCKLNFIKNNCCYICKYDNNLCSIINNEDVWKICNLYPANFSCYEKRRMSNDFDKKMKFEETECSFCGKKSFNNIIIDDLPKCKNCFYRKTIDNQRTDNSYASLISFYDDEFGE